MTLKPFMIRNENYVERTQNSFARQKFMVFLEAELAEVGPGSVEIGLDFQAGLSQQHGYFHGGVIGAIADNAGGYAAYTLLAASDSVLTIEYKLNIMAPALGKKLIARGRVLRPGRRVCVCQSDVYVEKDGKELLCATMLGTFMVMADQADDASGR